MYFSLQLLNFRYFVINKHNCMEIFGRVLNYINNVCVKFECSAFKSFWIVNFSENTKTHTDRYWKLWILFDTNFLTPKRVPYYTVQVWMFPLEKPCIFFTKIRFTLTIVCSPPPLHKLAQSPSLLLQLLHLTVNLPAHSQL